MISLFRSQGCAPSREKPGGKAAAILAALMAVFLAFRFWVLFTSLDLFQYEEMAMGAIAKESISGWITPFPAHAIAAMAQHGGLLFNCLVIGQIFRFLGENGIYAKLLWLFYAAATLALMFRMVLRAFNLRTAVLASLFFIFCPPFFTWFNLTETGTETAAIFLTMAIMSLNFRFLPFRDNPLKEYVLYGLFCGAAVAFTNYSLLLLSATLCYQLWFNWRELFTKKAAAFAAAFAAGLLPLVALFGGGSFQYTFSRSAHSAELLRGLREFLFDIVPHSLSFKDILFLRGEALDWAYYSACLLLLLAFLLRTGRNIVPLVRRHLSDRASKKLQLFFFLAFSAAAFVYNARHIFGGVEGEYRYLSFLYPFLFIALAVLVDRLLDAGRTARWMAATLAAALCALGLAGNLSLVAPGNCNAVSPPLYKPYTFTIMPYLIREYAGEDHAAVERACALLKRYAVRGELDFLSGMRAKPVVASQLFAVVPEIDAQSRAAFWRGVGSSVGLYLGYMTNTHVFEAETIRRLPPAYRCSGDGFFTPQTAALCLKEPLRCAELLSKLTPCSRLLYAERLGIAAGSAAEGEKDTAGVARLSSAIDPLSREKLLKGFAFGWGWRPLPKEVALEDAAVKGLVEGRGLAAGYALPPDAAALRSAAALVPASFRACFWEGAGEAAGYRLVNDPSLVLELCESLKTDRWIYQNHFTPLPVSLLEVAGDEDRAAYCYGIGRGSAQFMNRNTAIFVSKLRKHLSGGEYRALEEGVIEFGRELGEDYFMDLEGVYRKNREQVKEAPGVKNDGSGPSAEGAR